MRRAVLCVLLFAFILVSAGCGETITGVAKDVKRMGRGVRTVFIRDAN